jgi:hypothetical protein
MGRMIAIKTILRRADVTGTLEESGYVQFTVKELKKICNFVIDKADAEAIQYLIVVGRWGTNKAALRKLLAEKK